jgi:uncharacterized protein (UPF0335 family)
VITVAKTSDNPEIESLQNLIRDYFRLEVKYKRLKEERELINKSIKDLMMKRHLDTFDVDNLRAKVTLTTRRDINVATAEDTFRKLGLSDEAMAQYFTVSEAKALTVKLIK